MSLFDIFTGDGAQRAADAQKAGLTEAYSQASGLYGQGRGALTDYYGQGIKAIQSGFAPFAQGGIAGYNAYGDASGANGAEGLARARALFTQTPGYAEGLDRGLDALDRRAASRGMLGSGNNSQDTLKFANDYANQKYGSYLQGLSPYMNAPTQTNQNAALMGGLYSGLGGALNSNYMGQGGLAYGTQAGIGNAQANAELAKQQASGNIWGALFGGAKLASGLFGGFG